MTVSGLCSLLVVVTGFSGALRDPTLALFSLFVGGIPFLIGFGCFQGGRALLRDADRD